MASILAGPNAGGHQLMGLRTLDMEVQCFSPDLLTLFIDRTPQLRSLKLAVIIFGPDKQPEPLGWHRVPEVSRSSFYPLPQE